MFRKDELVASVLGDSPLNILFRRALLGDKSTKWTHLVSRLMSINLTQILDSFWWRLTIDDVFTVKSMYADVMDYGPIFRKKKTYVENKDSFQDQRFPVVFA